MEGQQRYKCKKCCFNFVDKPRRGHGVPTVGFAVWLYINGLSQRVIAKAIGVSPVAVMKWCKDFEKRKEKAVSREGLFSQKGVVTILEQDEIEAYLEATKIGSKKERLYIVIEDKALSKSSGFIIDHNATKE